jgi:ubiquitin C-terminal hydrolase
VSSKDEDFFDLQVDVDQNTSITHCLKCFSNTETLCSDNKFKCDHCSSYQEAQVGFLWALKILKHTLLQKGSKAVSPVL